MSHYLVTCLAGKTKIVRTHKIKSVLFLTLLVVIVHRSIILKDLREIYRIPDEHYPPERQADLNKTPHKVNVSKRGSYNLRQAEQLFDLFKKKCGSTWVSYLADDISYFEFLKSIRNESKKNYTIRHLREFTGESRKPKTWWEKFYCGINQRCLYDPFDPEGLEILEGVLHDLQTKKIVKAETIEWGATLKLRLFLEGGTQALYKPQRYKRHMDLPVLENGLVDEQYSSEIAAFHLDRVLGFFRVPPTTGRNVDMIRDLKEVGPEDVKQTFFTSKDGNACFYGVCKNCNKSFPICGNGTSVGGSLSLWLPWRGKNIQNAYKNPWRPSYKRDGKAPWQSLDDYCNQYVLSRFKRSFVLNFMDMAVFDFFIGQTDRHSFEFFNELGADTYFIAFDQGRSFGSSYTDKDSNLGPLRQCCLIRLSTLAKLLKLYFGPNALSDLMRISLTSDPLGPLLPESQLRALDRRLGKILRVVNECLRPSYKNGEVDQWDQVIIDDGWA